MAITNYNKSFRFAREHRVTIGAFNCFNMESIQACAMAAQDKKVPIILQCYHQHLSYCGADTISAIAHAVAPHVEAGLSIGLDHGQSYAQAFECIQKGFTGVMIDLSSSDFDENVAQTRRVVSLAHRHKVTVEAELGTIMSGSATLREIASGYTDPRMAKEFVETTQVDCLAVSIGTAHGLYKFQPRIQFDLLSELIQTVPCPIVVHGGSGTPDEDIAKMVSLGVSKLNVGTDFFVAFNKALKDYYTENGERSDVFSALEQGRKAVYETACHKLDILNSCRI